jgi:hypothetical protein
MALGRQDMQIGPTLPTGPNLRPTLFVILNGTYSLLSTWKNYEHLQK